eukprot:m.42084 g.42084  ORF g.42084 m.42084 type:complete len:211 (+) comp10646_c0_seq2:627-1259(+)
MHCLLAPIPEHSIHSYKPTGTFSTLRQNWAYLTFLVLMLLLTIQSGFLLKRTTEKASDTPSTDTARLYFDRATFVIWEIGYPVSLLVAIVYWALLDDGPATYDSFNAHGLSAVLLTVEFIINDMTLIGTHVVFLFYFMIAYLVFAMIHKMVADEWMYDFLDASDSLAAAWYIGVAFLHLVCYFGIFGLSKLKQHITKDQYDDLKAAANPV